MAYSNKFVMNILLDGEIVNDRESDHVAQIPFGSEYGLRLRNKNDRRAVVKIFIDNQNVSGAGYVVRANDKTDIFRHSDRDVAFKFVSLNSEQADDAGKSGPNLDGYKGIIEARFFLEKMPSLPPVQEHHHHHYHRPRARRITPTPINPPWYPPITTWSYSGGVTGQNIGTSQVHSFAPTSSGCSLEGLLEAAKSLSANDQPAQNLAEGCTVTGGRTGQNFTNVFLEIEETYTTVKIKLMGYDKPIQILQASGAPSAADHGFCTNCGAKRVPDGAKFCGNCGTRYGS